MDNEEIFSDNVDEDVIITLFAQNGQPIDFIEFARVAYQGDFYSMLQPKELLEGMSDDEAMLFKVTTDENGNDKFDIELDDEIMSAVFQEYNRLYDEELAKRK